MRHTVLIYSNHSVLITLYFILNKCPTFNCNYCNLKQRPKESKFLYSRPILVSNASVNVKFWNKSISTWEVVSNLATYTLCMIVMPVRHFNINSNFNIWQDFPTKNVSWIFWWNNFFGSTFTNKQKLI